VLLEKALSVCGGRGFDVEYVSLFDRQIDFCTVCDACKTQEDCAIDDDVNSILEKMSDADALILASPTYFGSVSGRLAALFDRTLPLRRNDFRLSGKVGGAIAVGGSRNGGQEKTIARIHDWMLIQDMVIVGDRKKTSHFGGIAHAHKPGAVAEDDTGMKSVVNLAEKIADTLERLG